MKKTSKAAKRTDEKAASAKRKPLKDLQIKRDVKGGKANAPWFDK